MKKFIKCISTLIISVFIFTAVPPGKAKAAGNEVDGLTKVASSRNLELYINKSDGNMAIKNTNTGYVWWANPPKFQDEGDKVGSGGIFKMASGSQILVNYADTSGNITMATSLVSSARREGLTINEIPNGVKVTYKFTKEGFVVPVTYTLEDDHFKATILTSEVKEPEKLIINTITLLPYMGAGGLTEKGYMVVPDGSGAIINFNNGKSQAEDYAQQVFGRDNAISQTFNRYTTETAMMPVFGINKQDQSILAVVTDGASRGIINAGVSGKKTAYNYVNCEFTYRSSDTLTLKEKNWDAKDIQIFETEPTKVKDFSVNYYFLSGKDSNYTGMAHRYQKYLTEQQGLKKQTKEGEVPFYLDLYGGIVKKKYILGIPVNMVQPLTTYKDAVDIVKQLKDLGVSDIVLKYKGWMNNGLEDVIPVSAAVESRLGGTSGFKKLVDFLKDNKVQFYPDADFVDFYKGSLSYIKQFSTSKGLNKAPALQYAFRLSTFSKNLDVNPWYVLSPTKLEQTLSKFTRNYSKYDVKGLSLTTLGKSIYADYGNHGIDRGAALNLWNSVLSETQKSVGSLAFSEANSYTFGYASHIMDAPLHSSGFDIEDEEIPFYQIVLHGYIPYSIPSANLFSDEKSWYLKALETGANIKYTWAAKNVEELKETKYDYLYSVNYKDWIDEASRQYKEFKNVFSKIEDKMIINHVKIQSGVYMTEYENNVRIVVNYNKEPVQVDGVVVDGEGYLLMGGKSNE